jgi:hypothetical protein
MASVSYATLLSNWFRVHIPLPQKPNIPRVNRTGYAGAYPKIKRSHRRRSNLFSCISNKTYQSKKKPSIRGCASFARYGTYQEGETEDDC